MEWSIKRFEEISSIELYDILRLREKVFVAEQECVYVDIDNLDQEAIHVQVRDNDQIVAYLRYRTVGIYDKIERVVLEKEVRGTGLGLELMNRVTQKIDEEGVGKQKLSAQTYAIGFYEKAGFKVVGKEYDDAGIAHVDMVRESK